MIGIWNGSEFVYRPMTPAEIIETDELVLGWEALQAELAIEAEELRIASLFCGPPTLEDWFSEPSEDIFGTNNFGFGLPPSDDMDLPF